MGEKEKTQFQKRTFPFFSLVGHSGLANSAALDEMPALAVWFNAPGHRRLTQPAEGMPVRPSVRRHKFQLEGPDLGLGDPGSLGQIILGLEPELGLTELVKDFLNHESFRRHGLPGSQRWLGPAVRLAG